MMKMKWKMSMSMTFLLSSTVEKGSCWCFWEIVGKQHIFSIINILREKIINFGGENCDIELNKL